MARPDGVTVYWRPGCMFCSSLIRELDGSGLRYRKRNIWQDEKAATFVRSVARGNETVPTVQVGPVALVNPTPRDVMAAVAQHSPDLLPEGYEPPQPGRFTRLLGKVLGAG